MAAIKSYREKFGLKNPPPGSSVCIKFMDGLKFYILWVDCLDLENVIQFNFSTKSKALEYINKNNWIEKNAG
jgi:hypothetical protein